MTQAAIVRHGACWHDVTVAYEHCILQYEVVLFTASVTLIKIDRIMY